MKYRQWKKNYKKKYGRNPSIIFDRRKRRKAVKRFNIKMSDLSADMISAIQRFVKRTIAIYDAFDAFTNVRGR